MPSYWWQCKSCGSKSIFPIVAKCSSIVTFIWDIMVPSDWEQSLLLRECPKCGNKALRITYDFPRKTDPVTPKVVQMVGLPPNADNYMAMLWETEPTEYPKERWLDFKYMNGKNPWGLNKAAVLSKQDLVRLIRVYETKTQSRLI